MSDMGVIGEDGTKISLEHQIQSLQEKHSELDAMLKEEEARPMPDSIAIGMLKRQKLAIKDEMAQLTDD